MQNIYFYKPIILRKSLDDMEGSQKKTALELLRSQKILSIGKDGIDIIEMSKGMEYPTHFFYGSEAVGIFRQSLGLPDVSIHSIDVDEILCTAEDFDSCYDFLYFLNRIGCKNCRAKKLSELGVPAIIQINEYRMLQESVEHLEDNNWNGSPDMNCYDTIEDGETVHHEEARNSLAGTGMSLLYNFDRIPDDDDVEADFKCGCAKDSSAALEEAHKKILKTIFGEDD